MCKNNYAVNNFCSCQQSCFSNPFLWGKKKKITTLNSILECLKEKEKEIEEALDEIKGQK